MQYINNHTATRNNYAEKGFVGELAVLLVLFAVIATGVFFFFGRSFFVDQTETATPEPDIQIPSSAIRVSACIPTEGEHWVELQHIKTGPYYVVHDGKVVSVEYMVIPDEIPGRDFAQLSPDQVAPYIAEQGSLRDLVNSWHMHFDLMNLEFDHFDIHWTPPHAGLTVPHYDIHFYLISEEERAGICPEATLEENFAPELLQQLKELNVPLPGADADIINSQ